MGDLLAREAEARRERAVLPLHFLGREHEAFHDHAQGVAVDRQRKLAAAVLEFVLILGGGADRGLDHGDDLVDLILDLGADGLDPLGDPRRREELVVDLVEVGGRERRALRQDVVDVRVELGPRAGDVGVPDFEALRVARKGQRLDLAQRLFRQRDGAIRICHHRIPAR